MQETTRRDTGPLGWWVVLAGWLVWGAINSIRLHTILDIDWPTAVWYGLPDALIWAGLTPVVVWLTRYFAQTGRSLARSLPLHALTAALLALIHSVLDASVAAAFNLAVGERAMFGAVFATVLPHSFHLNVLFYILVAGFAYYLLLLRRFERRERHAAELRAELSQAQLLRLQSQIRPHFLFNALHTISAHMHTDPERGQRILSRLGQLLRMSLNTEDRQTVPLREELAFLEAYLDVERARFGDRLEVVTEIDDSLLDAQVPALLLQPLVENAVHHGVSLNADGGRVTVAAAKANGDLRLTVADNGPGLRESRDVEDHGGLGLANSRARLQALFGDNQELTVAEQRPQGVLATVRLPYRPGGAG